MLLSGTGQDTSPGKALSSLAGQPRRLLETLRAFLENVTDVGRLAQEERWATDLQGDNRFGGSTTPLQKS
jgi:hypothetical protein